ncbi:anti-sigma factor [Nocardioides sp.]|uniref:anti-sigma factor n=1 Tax=Nocardioides sp. TaxID=35761 RepID=UPI002B5A5970|nr:anti-sigma factor [Nocardioides sp.]HSX67920.1 anti-sigma factor [Nocardioides sp.]
MSEIHALSGAYAVDALDEHERAQFERHLAECAECRAEVDSLRGAAASLAETTEAVPPAHLRADVLSAIKTVRPLPPLPRQDPAAGRTAGRGRRFRGLLVAAAAVAVVGTGTLVTQPWEDQPSTFDQVLAASDVDTASVPMNGGKVTVYRSESVGRAALKADDMPAPPEGKVYELWLQVDGEMVPAGLIDASGDQELVLTGDASQATAAGITVEPDGGSPQPTTTPIALFDLTQET